MTELKPTWKHHIGVQHVTSTLTIPYACNCPAANFGQCIQEFKVSFWRPDMSKEIQQFLDDTVKRDQKNWQYTQIYMPVGKDLQLWWFGGRGAFGFIKPGHGVVAYPVRENQDVSSIEEALRIPGAIKVGDLGSRHILSSEYTPTITKWLQELSEMPCSGISKIEKSLLSAVHLL